MSAIYSKGVRDYSYDILQSLARDLAKNNMSYRNGTWEQGRLEAVRLELKRRRRDAL